MEDDDLEIIEESQMEADPVDPFSSNCEDPLGSGTTTDPLMDCDSVTATVDGGTQSDDFVLEDGRKSASAHLVEGDVSTRETEPVENENASKVVTKENVENANVSFGGCLRKPVWGRRPV